MKRIPFIVFILIFCLSACDKKENRSPLPDKPFIQNYSIKYYTAQPGAKPLKVVCDRNGYIQVISDRGLFIPSEGTLLYPSTLEPDNHYKYFTSTNILVIGTYRDQIFYCDNEHLFSNAWAGNLNIKHHLSGIRTAAADDNLKFLLSDGKTVILADTSGILKKYELYDEEITDIRYSPATGRFFLLGKSSLMTFSPNDSEPEKIFSGTPLTCFDIYGNIIIAGTSDGYFRLDLKTGKPEGQINSKMPCTELTTLKVINGTAWFGSVKGAMKLREDGRFDYYASERWLPSDTVIDISRGPDNSVLVLTTAGLARICFAPMTLAEKAGIFEKQVRQRHIRYGFNATLALSGKGDLSTGSLEDSDNDGLWTGLYLASQAFRYIVTRSGEALQNVRESLEAMERLYTINPVPGFPARSFEKTGLPVHDPDRWYPSPEEGWMWKSTTSSDEAIGHMFAFGVAAELISEPDIRNKAVSLIDTLMSHIVKNNFYLIDIDGKPTRWGRWNPEYVNALHPAVGDRKLNSSNIISMLQTAYHFTGKEKYRDAAFYLMNEHGYLENLMRPMSEIGRAPADADETSRMLSDSWNHSDDEMYYCGYWGLYRYAFNDTLREKYRQAIIDHWQAEKPEKEALWNIMTYMTGEKDCGLEDALWFLREYPLDLITWDIRNSHRKDIEHLQENFRNQTITEVLPPDELPVSRHNTNRFMLDGGNGGMSEMSAGDIWLLPYWMGRYLNVIK